MEPISKQDDFLNLFRVTFVPTDALGVEAGLSFPRSVEEEAIVGTFHRTAA
jgi:hypothetical protein